MVRLELASALAIGLPVVPILIRRAEMPRVADLPDELKTLAELQPQRFTSDDTFRGDMIRLHHRIAAASIKRTPTEVPTIRDDSLPTDARRAKLSEDAKRHLQEGKHPFEGESISTLGEVNWILGAQSGELGMRYGARQFPPDLSKANLSKVNLSGADMYGASLCGADLSHANLSGSNLGEANLDGADLRSANLTGARLSKSSMVGAQISEIVLQNADLRGARLQHLDLTHAILTGATMDDALMSGAHLDGLELPGVSLQRADLSNAELTDMNLQRARMEDAVLAHAKLNHSKLSEAKLTGADLSDAELNGTDLGGVDLSGVVIKSVQSLEQAVLDGNTSLEGVKWDGQAITEPRRIRSREDRLAAYRTAAQIYHQIAEMQRKMGLIPESSAYRLKELRMRRGLLLNTEHFGAWITSVILNAISGYGERIGRTLGTYFFLVLGFAIIYFAGSNFLHIGTAHVSVSDALIESFVSFHGRGFVITTLRSGDPMAGVTVVEAVFGLFLEAIFIATFSRRFLNQ
jgi:uncharacterized protein YjbI with pentapeptide repeats